MMIMTILCVLFLAYANGANDNFKGVATLFGSGTADYKKSISWATMATFLGSAAALIFAQGLIITFSGKGLVPDSIAGLQSFPISVGFGAALTVMLATLLGFPISTTHALTGALVGAGLVASHGNVNFSKLGSSFFLPLLLSPLVAVISATLIYPVFRFLRKASGVEKETCVCVGSKVIATVPLGTSPELMLRSMATLPEFVYGKEPQCRQEYVGKVFGLNARETLDSLHFLSAGIVSFARGLNDTPKIAAMLLISQALTPSWGILTVGLLIGIGGILNAKNVAETMSHRVTAMNHGQGFTANLLTGLIVIFASKLGMPVSTTHVSCGALFGIGAVTRQARWKVIISIFTAWVTTLPIAALLGAIAFQLMKGLSS